MNKLLYKVTCVACPTQVEGSFNEHLFYFRYRYGRWSLDIVCDFLDDEGYAFEFPHYHYSQVYGDSLSGFMSDEEALSLITMYGALLLTPEGRTLLGVLTASTPGY